MNTPSNEAEIMPIIMCERCDEYPATDADELCDFCGEEDNLAAIRQQGAKQ